MLHNFRYITALQMLYTIALKGETDTSLNKWKFSIIHNKVIIHFKEFPVHCNMNVHYLSIKPRKRFTVTYLGRIYILAKFTIYSKLEWHIPTKILIFSMCSFMKFRK
jgi:hypothetical protein